MQWHNRTPVGEFPAPEARFQHIRIYIVGHLPVGLDFSYLMTIVDRLTRFSVTLLMQNITTVTVAQSLVDPWI